MIVHPHIVISHNDEAGVFLSPDAILYARRNGVFIFRMESFKDFLNFRLSCHFRGIFKFRLNFFN
jgi:hypothetical protein